MLWHTYHSRRVLQFDDAQCPGCHHFLRRIFRILNAVAGKPVSLYFSLFPIMLLRAHAAGQLECPGQQISFFMARRILVTGANKGIGLAIVKAILDQSAENSVILCARDGGRGQEAAAALVAANPELGTRLSTELLDVCGSEESIRETAARVAAGGPLFAIVNNAGVLSAPPADIFETNLYGVKKVCDAFIEQIQPGGRIVNISSGAAPGFLEKCSDSKKELFAGPDVTWAQIEDQADVFLQLLTGPNGVEACESAGFGKGDATFFAYGCSKCLLNSFTIALARAMRERQITVNSCSPGMIMTDLFAPMAASKGQSVEELAAAFGALPPEQGTVSTLRLLFAPAQELGTGRYFGSDGLRSPMAIYRKPGTAEYDGSGLI